VERPGPGSAVLQHRQENVAQKVAGERGDATAAEPGGFARAGQADGEDHESFGRWAEPRRVGSTGFAASRAAFQLRAARTSQAGRSTPASWATLASLATAASGPFWRGCALRPRRLRLPGFMARGAAGGRAARHLDRAEPAEPVDSMGVPGRFCPWILKYLVRVWSVFSCCLFVLAESLRFHPNTILGECAANLVHSVTYSSIAGTPS